MTEFANDVSSRAATIRLLTTAQAPGDLTVAEAVAWYVEQAEADTAPHGEPAVGFAYAPGSAPWFRLDAAGRPAGVTGPLDLGEVFELRLFDGWRELRWLHSDGRRGRAVLLSDVEAAEGSAGGATGWEREPDVDEVVPGATGRPFRVGGPVRRMLDGRPHPVADGWVRLRSGRYAPADVPVEAGAAQHVMMELLEYAVEDAHGNRTVVDARLLGLTALDGDDVRPPEAPQSAGGAA